MKNNRVLIYISCISHPRRTEHLPSAVGPLHPLVELLSSAISSHQDKQGSPRWLHSTSPWWMIDISFKLGPTEEAKPTESIIRWPASGEPAWSLFILTCLELFSFTVKLSLFCLPGVSAQLEWWREFPEVLNKSFCWFSCLRASFSFCFMSSKCFPNCKVT